MKHLTPSNTHDESFSEQEQEERISIQDLIEKIQSLHSNTIDEHDDEQLPPFRAIYLYGSSVYENKASLIKTGHDEIQVRGKSGDLDILLVRDGFRHCGSILQDCLVERDERDVFFEQDITLHFKLKGSMGSWFEIETHIMSTSIFMETIRQHKGITCQYVFMDRSEFVLYEDELMRWFRSFWFRNFHFHRRLFRRMIVREADVWCYSKARRLMTIEKDFEKGKKNLIHGIRYFRLANQILENLTISDYTVANDLKKQVISESSIDWSYWEGVFEPMYLSEREGFNQRVDNHIRDGLRVALEYNDKIGASKLCKIIEDYGLQYLSLNFSTDIVPLAIFNERGEELDLIKYLTCGKMIAILIRGSKLNSEEYIQTILKQLLNSTNDDIRGYSVLFKITQLEDMERIEETIPRRALRETNGIIVSATISHSLELEYKVVAMPLPKFFDEFRWLNTNTKNKSLSNHIQISDIEEISEISKNYRGDFYVLYNYCGNWRWSHPTEEFDYFTKLSNIRNRNTEDAKDEIWKLLSKETNMEEVQNKLSSHLSKNFIFIRPRSENYLSLVAVRDSDNLVMDVEFYSKLLFNCKFVQHENIDTIFKDATELSSELLYKSPYKCSTQKERNLLTLLKYLYFRANSLEPIYDGFTVKLKLNSGEEYYLVCQSQFYYNMSQLTIWHTSINIDDVEDGKFNKFHGNILSQSNQMLLIEMALTWLEFSHDEKVMESERKNNPKIIPFSEIYFTIKHDWKQICKLYDDFSEVLNKKIVENSLQGKEVTKFISQNADDFELENKTIIYKIAESNFVARAIEVFNSPKKTIDSNSLVKIWKDYKKKINSNK